MQTSFNYETPDTLALQQTTHYVQQHQPETYNIKKETNLWCPQCHSRMLDA